MLGYLEDIVDGKLILRDNAADNIAHADQFSENIKQMIDGYIEKAGLELPPLEQDPADEPDLDFSSVNHIERLNLEEADIKAVIWTTGFIANFDWIHLPVLDNEGIPIHTRGISPVPGIYFLGFPWLHSRKSGIINGIEEDAGYLFEDIRKRLG